jgi:hypothetical protein
MRDYLADLFSIVSRFFHVVCGRRVRHDFCQFIVLLRLHVAASAMSTKDNAFSAFVQFHQLCHHPCSSCLACFVDKRSLLGRSCSPRHQTKLTIPWLISLMSGQKPPAHPSTPSRVAYATVAGAPSTTSGLRRMKVAR